MAGKIKKKDHEKLDDANIELVMGLRQQEKPITIKEACERLNIAVNGARLTKIFVDFEDRRAEDKRRRSANRGKPASDFETQTTIEQYLGGESLKTISDMLYRPVSFVKKIIEEVGVPQALPGENYTNYGLLPEQCVSDEFTVGEYVWSAKDGAIAEVDKFHGPNANGVNIYRIYVHQRIDRDKMLIDGKHFDFQPQTGGGYYSNAAAFDLGSLRHLAKYGIDVKRAIK